MTVLMDGGMVHVVLAQRVIYANTGAAATRRQPISFGMF
jgi:hypothetical protein